MKIESDEAEVTPADKARAPRFWGKYATPLLKRLLAAVREQRVAEK